MRIPKFLVAVLGVVLIAVAGCSSTNHASGKSLSSPSTPQKRSRSTPPKNTQATPSKVLVVVEENHSFNETKAGMPYLWSLAGQYGYATNYTGVSYPSEPNYLAIAGGSTFGVTNDDYPSANAQQAQSVFDQAIANGGTAKTYNQSMPGNCTVANAYPYAVKHNPWAFFLPGRKNCNKFDVSTDTLWADARSNKLPNVGMVTPNMVDDAHDGTLTQADSFLKSLMPTILQSSDFTTGKLAVVITADTDDQSQSNHVLTVVCDEHLSGAVVSAPLNHYGLSRSLSRIAGAAPLNQAANATDVLGAFGL